MTTNFVSTTVGLSDTKYCWCLANALNPTILGLNLLNLF